MSLETFIIKQALDQLPCKDMDDILVKQHAYAALKIIEKREKVTLFDYWRNALYPKPKPKRSPKTLIH